MITIIDYGVGNLGSVAKAFEYLGIKARVTSSPGEVLEAERVVLPGVGAFTQSMQSLERSGMIPVVKEVIASGRPFLGICLGLQMLFETSTEVFGDENRVRHGLGVFQGEVVRFPSGSTSACVLKVPQIGWNQIHPTAESPLFRGVPDGSFVYFVHSYYVKPADPKIVACTTEYGLEYCSGIAVNQTAAVQFHPEKSGKVGLSILKNFAEFKR